MSPARSPSGEVARANPRQPQPRRPIYREDTGIDGRLLLWSLAGLTLFRLLMAGLIPLTEDEAYYRLWSMRPQLGYYDHPPMVAWGIALGELIAGKTALGVRLLPVIGAALTTLLLYESARLCGAGERLAARAAAWFNATLLIGFGAMLAVPDAPSTLFWTTTLWALLKARATGRPVWWLVAGLAAGLATLSKYSALFLAPGVFLWLISSPEGRAELKRPWPWAAAAIAGALFGLNVGWNAQHHWVSFVKQFGRAVPGPPTLRFVGELLGAQLILLNPLIAIFAWRAFDPTRLKQWPARIGLFVAVSAPFLAYLLLHSLHDRVQQHWAAPLYPALALGAAVVADGARPGSALCWLRRAAAPFGLALSSAALIYLAAGLHAGGKTDPALQLYGWPGFAATLDAERAQSGAAWVGALSYGVAGQLATRGEIKAPVLQLNERERYAFLPDSGADLSRPGLVVDLARRGGSGAEALLAACFAEVRPLGQIYRGPLHSPKALYQVWRVSGLRGATLGGCSK
jgi:4-amino-4-deoxy-L-arabinose transferase-like glycosyltransferase